MGSDSLHLNMSAVLCLPFPAALAPLRSQSYRGTTVLRVQA